MPFVVIDLSKFAIASTRNFVKLFSEMSNPKKRILLSAKTHLFILTNNPDIVS